MAKSELSFPERKKAAMYAKVDIMQRKVARLLVILMLCVQPLYLNQERYISLTHHKWVFFVVCMCFILLVAMIIWAVRMARNPKLFPQDRLSLVDWAVLGFAAVTMLSALLSQINGFVFDYYFDGEGRVFSSWIGSPERNDGAITQLLYVSIFFIVSRWYRPKIKDFMLFGIAASIVAIIGILQFYGMDFLNLWPHNLEPVDNYFNIQFRTTLGNTNIVSTYVSVAIMLCGFLFIKIKSKWQPLWLVASALNFWLMDFGGADSGVVGIMAAMFIGIPFIVENFKTLGRFLILASSWAAVFTLQRLLFHVNILVIRTPGSLLPFVAAVIILLAFGLVLLVIGKKRDSDAISDETLDATSNATSNTSPDAISNAAFKATPDTSDASDASDASPDSPSDASPNSSSDAPPDAPIKWKLGVILMAACLVVALIGVEVAGRPDAETGVGAGMIYEAREILHGNIRDEFGTNRIYIWRHALALFPDNPIIGSGPDTFRFVFPPEAQFRYDEFYENAHNEYIHILVSQGILGLLAYLVFLGGIFLKAVPISFRNPLVAVILVAFTCYCAQAFFNLSLPITSQILWVFAGMLASKRFRETPLSELVAER